MKKLLLVLLSTFLFSCSTQFKHVQRDRLGNSIEVLETKVTTPHEQVLTVAELIEFYNEYYHE